MFCIKCGAQNRDGAKFCKQCGAPLSAPKVQAPVQEPVNTPQNDPPVQQPIQQNVAPMQQPVQQNMAPMQQPQQYIQPQSLQQQYNQSQNYQQVSSQPKKKKTGLIVAISVMSVLIIGITIVIIMMLTGGNVRPESSSKGESADRGEKPEIYVTADIPELELHKPNHIRVTVHIKKAALKGIETITLKDRAGVTVADWDLEDAAEVEETEDYFEYTFEMDYTPETEDAAVLTLYVDDEKQDAPALEFEVIEAPGSEGEELPQEEIQEPNQEAAENAEEAGEAPADTSSAELAQYMAYVANELVPYYGLSNMEETSMSGLTSSNFMDNIAWDDRSGICSYSYTDMNMDGQKELILYRFAYDESNSFHMLQLLIDIYTIIDGEVCIYGEFIADDVSSGDFSYTKVDLVNTPEGAVILVYDIKYMEGHTRAFTGGSGNGYRVYKLEGDMLHMYNLGIEDYQTEKPYFLVDTETSEMTNFASMEEAFITVGIANGGAGVSPLWEDALNPFTPILEYMCDPVEGSYNTSYTFVATLSDYTNFQEAIAR